MRAVMVMYDSLNRRMLPPYGADPAIHAPNFVRLAQRTVTFTLHQDLSGIGLGLAMVHAAVLMIDTSVPYSPIEVLVPFGARCIPGATTSCTGRGAPWSRSTTRCPRC